ncbi:MAG TPA: hypothetical protein VK547_09735 [Candidatus Udaeobacter sp.]|nr:hypothetical protein [Candidatus Udaeobacter sp.]
MTATLTAANTPATDADLCADCGGTAYCADDCACDDCLDACDLCGAPAAELYTRLAPVTVGDWEHDTEVRVCETCADSLACAAE